MTYDLQFAPRCRLGLVGDLERSRRVGFAFLEELLVHLPLAGKRIHLFGVNLLDRLLQVAEVLFLGEV